MRWLCVLFLSMSFVARSQDEEMAERLANIDTVIGLIEEGRVAELAQRVEYPLERPGPIPDIMNEREFILYFPVLFDSTFQAQLTTTKYNEHSIIGDWEYGIIHGMMWFDYLGNIIAVNYSSDEEKGLLYRLENELKSLAHDTLEDWESNEVELTSEKFYIRVDLMPDGEWRYAAWNQPKTISDKPDVVMIGGEQEFQGTIGGVIYKFPRGNYEYQVSRVDAGPTKDSLGWWVIVYHDGKEIMKHKMEPVH